MSRKLVFAALLLASVVTGGTAALAAQCTSIMTPSPNGTPMWVGAMRFVKGSAQCNGAFFSHNDVARSSYRPYLVSGDNPSAFTHILGTNHVMLITNTNATAQFSGTGNYRNCGISNTAEFSGPVTGGYSFTQTPTLVDTNTTTITLDGYIGNYANIAGCKLFFQAVYVRDPQTLP
jgi:hypothetical protein